MFYSYEAYLEDLNDRWSISEAEVNRERYHAELKDMENEGRIEEEESRWRWLQRPWFERFQYDLVDAGCAAARAIAEGLFIPRLAEDDDIPF